MNRVILDLETTGLRNRDRIMEIAMIKFDNNGILDIFQTFVNCIIPISREIERLTGITNVMIRGFPTINELKSEIFNFMNGCKIYSYNSNFESRFLANELFTKKIIDLLGPVKKSYKLESYKLEEVSRSVLRYKLRPHSALSDAFAGYLVFKKLRTIGAVN